MHTTSLIAATSNWLFLSAVAGIPLYGQLKKVKVYESFIEGGKEGFNIIISIIPYMVAMIVGIGMLRASGALHDLSVLFAPLLNKIGVPSEVLPLAVMRPFSGAAANGILADLIHSHGANSMIAKIAATMIGSTETTFYVVAIYFGAVNIRRTRHAVPAGLLADLVGVLASVWICKLLF